MSRKPDTIDIDPNRGALDKATAKYYRDGILDLARFNAGGRTIKGLASLLGTSRGRVYRLLKILEMEDDYNEMKTIDESKE